MNKENRVGVFTPKNLATLGILAALVMIFQMALGMINIGGTSFSIVLIPIVLGSLLIGPWAGALLGFIFSLIVFLYGVFGADPFTHLMIEANWFLTMIVCFLKGILAGFVPGLVYKALYKKNEYLGSALASISAPIVNTGIFVGMMLLLQNVFIGALSDAYGFTADAAGFANFVIRGLAGINFIVEFAVNAIAIPAIHTIVRIVERSVIGEKK